MSSGTEFDPVTRKNLDLWLEGPYDDETKSQIKTLIKESPKEAVDAFYCNLSFGTGGMRGIMGVGTNRMNLYTVRAATQGLANYVSRQPSPLGGHSAFIGYDSRHNSRFFAEEAAKVLAANQIQVYLCKDLRPTPLVSFGCRYKHCTTAIMITASHNPRDYNGYKVYWSDGAQVLPPHDEAIISEVNKITSPVQVKTVTDLKNPLISFVGEEIDRVYIDEGSRLQLYPELNKKHGSELKVVYTSLHGTGITLAPRMFAAWGFTKVKYVDQQIIPDPDFPTATVPNPEEKAALALGIDKLKQTESDILIATDPDADRMGVVVSHQGDPIILTGNQIACICLEHICEGLTDSGKMPKSAAFIKTIVTTELFQAICDGISKPCINVLTGFKYIAEKIRGWENDPHGNAYVFGAEESYGYLYGTLTRDKDAIISSALICEVALHAKRKGLTLVDLLHSLYKKYGVYTDEVLSVIFAESKEGKEQMKACMKKLRENYPKSIGGVPVVRIEDFKTLKIIDCSTGKSKPLHSPVSDVILWWLEDNTKLIARPSGTEPKVKLYCGTVVKNHASIHDNLIEGKKRTQTFLANLKKLIVQ